MKATKIMLILALLTLNVLADRNLVGNDIVGTWLTGNKEARVIIFKNGDYYYGKISWLKDPLDENGRPKTDIRNHDEELQTKPVMNLLILKSFQYNPTDEIWENGTIYDPKNGKTYSCKLELTTQSTMEVRGYVGISLVGRTETWVRME